MYTAQGTLDRDRLVQQYTPLVKRVAHHLMMRLPANVLVDDLVQNGMIGLLDALNRFVDDQGGQFESYAVQRVRGAMLDGLRSDDWVPRGVRKEMRRVEAVLQQLEHQQETPPSEGELASALGMKLEEYQRLLQEARGCQIVGMEDLSRHDEDFLEQHAPETLSDPLDILAEIDLRTGLVAAIEKLPEREKLLMALYYEQDLNLREIGEVMGVTESRVCQIHTQAILRLRAAVVVSHDENGSHSKLKRQRRKTPSTRFSPT